MIHLNPEKNPYYQSDNPRRNPHPKVACRTRHEQRPEVDCQRKEYPLRLVCYIVACTAERDQVSQAIRREKQV